VLITPCLARARADPLRREKVGDPRRIPIAEKSGVPGFLDEALDTSSASTATADRGEATTLPEMTHRHDRGIGE
jgi:hypothetical protein